MTTALDIIVGAAKLIGVVFKSETLDDDEAQDGLTALNDLLDSWSNDNLSTYAYTLESFPLTNMPSFTMGIGGDFNTVRPINIATAVLRFATVDYDLDIITLDEYQTEIPVKSISSPIPQVLAYDNNYPLATIRIYPVPQSGSTLFLQSNKPLANLSSLTASVDLPPGWKRALKSNLSIDLAPEYGVEVPPTVIEMAKNSLGAIRRATAINQAMPLMSGDSVRYSILGGTPGN